MRGILILLLMTLCSSTIVAAPIKVAATAIAYSRDGALLFVAQGQTVFVFDANSGDPLHRIEPLPGRVTALATGPNHELAIASGEVGKSGTLRVYSARPDFTPKQLGEVVAHKDAIYALAINPKGSRIATGSYDRTIKLWDMANLSTPVQTLTDHSDAVYSVAFNPQSELLASASADRAVKVWDTKTGRRLYTLADSTDWLYSVCWSPDGKRLAAGGIDKSVRVWQADVAGGKLLASAFAHQNGVQHVAFAPDGKTLFTVGEDRAIKAWDALKLVEQKSYPLQPDQVHAFAVRPDGKQLAIARHDATAVTIDRTTGKDSFKLLPFLAKPATISRTEPEWIPRGTTTRLKLFGQRLNEVTKFTLPGGTITIVPGTVTPVSATLEIVSGPTTKVGEQNLLAESPVGVSAPAKVGIDYFPTIAETTLQPNRLGAIAVTLPLSVAGVLDRSGDVDTYSFHAKAGQEIGVHLLHSNLKEPFDPYLQLAPLSGEPLAESSTGFLGVRIRQDGDYTVSVRDANYRGSKMVGYRLAIGAIPIVTSHFPLSVERGKTTQLHLEGVNLGLKPGQMVPIVVPEKHPTDTPLSFPSSAATWPMGEPLGLKPLAVREGAKFIVGTDGVGQVRTVPSLVEGILARPDSQHIISFQAKKGEPLILETEARRLGAPTDTRIELLDSNGQPLQRAVLRCVAKTNVTFRDHDAEKPGIRLDAWNELAIDDYLYIGTDLVRIVSLPKGPDDDCQFYEDSGQRSAFEGTTPTYHALGEMAYKVEIHPPQTTFAPNGMPVFPIFYQNDDGEPRFQSDSYLQFNPPADGTYQVRISDTRGDGGADFGYLLHIRTPRPRFEVTLKQTTVSVAKASAKTIIATAERFDGYNGPIQLKFENLPPGIEIPPTQIEAGQLSTIIAVTALATAPTTNTQTMPIAVIATGGSDKAPLIQKLEITKVTVTEPGDLIASTDPKTLQLVPGQETRLNVTIERRNGFAGRVPVEVRGLPHGVRVMNIGLNGIMITERDTKREIVIYAEQWVKPQTVPIVFVARIEKKATEHAAMPIMLELTPTTTATAAK